MKFILLLPLLAASLYTNAQLSTSWSRSVSSTGNDFLNAMAIDNEGNSIYTVYARNQITEIMNGSTVLAADTGGYREMVIFKLDNAGNPAWTYRIDAGWYSYGYSIDTDKSNNIYVFGTFEGTVDFDADTSVFNLSSPNSYPSHFVLKLDPNGNFIWAKHVQVRSRHWSNKKIIVTPKNEIFLTGGHTGSADFDPDTGIVSGITPYWGIYILKLDSTGGFEWVKEWGDRVSIYGTTINKEGDITFAGTFQLATDFDPDTGSTYTISPNGNHDAFICQLDSSGNFKWVKKIPTYYIEISDLLQDNQDNLYLYGNTIGLTDFDSTNLQSYSQITDTTQEHLFHVKYDKSGNFLWLNDIGNWYQHRVRAATMDANGYGFLSANHTSGFNRSRIMIFKISPYGTIYWTKYYNSSYSSISYFTSLAVDDAGKVHGAGEFKGDLFGQTGKNNSGFMLQFQDTTVGINELNFPSENITIYPNPSSNILNIKSHKSIKRASIYDVQGRLISVHRKNTLDLLSLKKGVYFIQVETAEEMEMLKFLKD